VLPDIPLFRSASMWLMGSVPPVRLAVIRALVDEIDRLTDEGDWGTADAVSRQLTEELELLSVAFPVLLATGFLPRTVTLAPGQQRLVEAR
jgi:hypothetical protein